MQTHSKMIEALRLRSNNLALSKIAVRLLVAKSTLQGWFYRLDQAGIDYRKAKNMTPYQIGEELAKLRRPTTREYQPDWLQILTVVSGKEETLQFCYDKYVQEAASKNAAAMSRSSFYEKYRHLTKNLPPDLHRFYLHNSSRLALS